MHVIRRGLFSLILVAPLVLAASVTSAPTSQADQGCDSTGAGAYVSPIDIGTYVCLIIDKEPAAPRPLSTGTDGGGPPLVCWLEPQYTPATFQTMIASYKTISPMLYADWTTYYGGLTPPYEGGASGWWWGVGCDKTNPNANTYMTQVWDDVGLSWNSPWKWEPDEVPPAAPNNEVTTPETLAEYAREAATLDEPYAQMSPAYSNGVSTQTVGLPTYFWGQIGDGPKPVAAHNISASVQDFPPSDVQAIPTLVTITTTGVTKGPSTIDCPVTGGTFGTAYTDNTTIDSACSFTYNEPSTGITITMTTNWTVSWLEAPAGDTAWPVQAQSVPHTYGGITVQEVQTINNGSAPTPTS